MKLGNVVVVLGLGSLLLAACSGSGSDDSGPTIQTSWSVAGTVELPVGEAGNLKVLAIKGETQKVLVSDVVSLQATGTPATADFLLNINAGSAASDSSDIVDLYVFDDVNDNSSADAGELGIVLTPADASCAVWGDGETNSPVARFKYSLADSNIPETGWYYSNCDLETDCLNQITSANKTLSGARLKYAVTLQRSCANISTNYGDIVVELNGDRAPVTVQNFLTYVDEGFYSGTIFHRVIDGFMIQGGGLTEAMVQKATHDPIINEADNGLSNLRGTIAMARLDPPHTATSQFFINVVNNTGLDYTSPTAWGYAVFGTVVSGMSVADAIRQVETDASNDVPVSTVLINSVERVSCP